MFNALYSSNGVRHHAGSGCGGRRLIVARPLARGGDRAKRVGCVGPRTAKTEKLEAREQNMCPMRLTGIEPNERSQLSSA
eukprot:3229977-Pyramimonas_sp.AAC.1